MEEHSITMNNKRISDFYKKNPSMDIETNNLLFIDLFENIFQQGVTINKSLSSQILNEISGLNTRLHSMQNNVSNLSSELILKFLDIKKEYIEDMKVIINSNTSNTSEKINTLIEKNNSHLIDKTTLLLNDIIPKNQELQYNQMQDKLTHFYHLINADTKQILSQSGTSSLQDFISNFETKYSSMIYNIQNSSEERITKSISSLKDTSTINNSTQEKTMNELSEFLNKYRSSFFKGQFGENLLASLLTNMFPSAEIIDTSGTKASGDFIMNRENKETILFENKDYDRNITADEIKKFIRDCDTQNCHGIFLSQRCGIVMKTNYQIDINKGCILVYVHNTEYTNSRVQIAIDIIDSLSNTLKELNMGEEDKHSISKEVIEDINNEYKSFISQKENLSMVLKDFNKKMSNEIDKVNLPSLDKFLSTKFANSVKKLYVCEFCNKYSASTVKILSAHTRACKTKHKVTNSIANVSLSINEIIDSDSLSDSASEITIDQNEFVLTIPESNKEKQKEKKEKSKDKKDKSEKKREKESKENDKK
jgi:hypothetical protein